MTICLLLSVFPFSSQWNNLPAKNNNCKMLLDAPSLKFDFSKIPNNYGTRIIYIHIWYDHICTFKLCVCIFVPVEVYDPS